MERALFYEYLIRAVYKCGRTNKHGADADIYRWMLSVSDRFPNMENREYKLGVMVGKVSAHLSEALGEAISLYGNNLEFKAKIEKCVSYLNEPTVEKLNNCVDETWEAFTEIGLKAE
ncbi:MAG TPA: hypothetical protein GXX42_03880 [Petrimonas sp.]|jgi:hypothetical protein|uniref:hypothetical protein n=1 Tax=Bacteria TaxID=2 RepID=UPI0009603644|nr:hypothetical protein [Lutispora sp.]MDK2837837.1 hypothetical protein [Bacteroidota bacterium]MDK2979228.1 hypothetical protein [Bacteroidales bacterium]MDN5291055.1 hypothetical protein [Anaerophaga sp.]OJV36882.1 MAG: hypothetical protein BGO33_10185 [Bacteroidia bacterium 43-41]HHV84946.1 hypothetical protein [Petrimonas sp.]